MSDEQKFLPWKDGLPTKPDVDLLLKTWPEPKVGDRFAYDSIEAILGVDRGDPRFRTVTTQWRKRLVEQGCVLECERGEAFFVASAEQISAGTYDTLRGIGRKAHRHRRKLSVSRPENDTQRTVIEHQARLLNGIEREAKKARMNLLPSTAAPVTPKITPPEKKAG